MRLARGWTQHEAAEKAGMTDRFIRKAETGQPLELKSVSPLAQLYSTPHAPLTLEQLLAERLLPLPSGEGGREGDELADEVMPQPKSSSHRVPSGWREGIHHAERDAYDAEALARRWFDEVWNQGRLETIAELIAPDCVLRADGRTLHGRAEIRRRTETIRAAFSNIDLHLDQVVVQDDWIVSRWRAAMTHTGRWMGRKPTNKRLEVRGCTLLRILDGLFVEGCTGKRPVR